MLRISYLDFARHFASWHLVLPFHMVRNRHLCRLRSPTAGSCSSGGQSPPYEGPYKVLVHGDKSFVLDYGTRKDSVSIDRLKPAFVDPITDRGCQTSPSRSSTYRRGDQIWPPRQTPGTLYSPLTGAGGGSVADWPTGQSLFLMSHPDVSLVNILLSITRVSLVQNKCVFCQLRVHYNNEYTR